MGRSWRDVKKEVHVLFDSLDNIFLPFKFVTFVYNGMILYVDMRNLVASSYIFRTSRK